MFTRIVPIRFHRCLFPPPYVYYVTSRDSLIPPQSLTRTFVNEDLRPFFYRLWRESQAVLPDLSHTQCKEGKYDDDTLIDDTEHYLHIQTVQAHQVSRLELASPTCLPTCGPRFAFPRAGRSSPPDSRRWRLRARTPRRRCSRVAPQVDLLPTIAVVVALRRGLSSTGGGAPISRCGRVEVVHAAGGGASRGAPRVKGAAGGGVGEEREEVPLVERLEPLALFAGRAWRCACTCIRGAEQREGRRAAGCGRRGRRAWRRGSDG